jgi:type IV secretion system protein VirD4
MTSSTAARRTASGRNSTSVSPPHVHLPRHYVSFAHVLLHDVIVVVLLLALAFLVVSALWWAFWPHHRMPRNRVRHLALRAHLRLHPGPGHATAFELWLRWGRLASWRESKRTRPSLSAWHRLTHPGTHSLFLGWAHYFLRIRISVQEHLAVIGPPRSWKSALLSWLIMKAPGPVVSTSSKPDMFALTSGVRARCGHIWVFNPQGIGGIASNVMWSPLDGCANPATARRRAEAFALAVSMAGADDGGFFAGKAADSIAGMFTAAAATGRDMRRVSAWAGTELVGEAIDILAGAGYTELASQLAELTGPADKTAGTVRMVISRALSFLQDPQLAIATLPTPGNAFDIDDFLTSGGTLYMIAKGTGEECTLAPLFSALATEIEYRATQLGARMPGQRLDPPLLLCLDEVTQICPVPVPAWAADAGGQGVQLCLGFHGLAQLKSRWGVHGAQTVLDTCGCKIVTPGVSDDDLLRQLSSLCGQVCYRERGNDDRLTWHDVLTVAMLRQLPPQFMVIIRGAYAPVLAKLARGWRHKEYRRLARIGQATVPVSIPQDERPRRRLSIVPPLPGDEPGPERNGASWPRRRYPFSPAEGDEGA